MFYIFFFSFLKNESTKSGRRREMQGYKHSDGRRRRRRRMVSYEAWIRTQIQHGDTAKLKTIGHKTRHVYTYYFQTFN